MKNRTSSLKTRIGVGLNQIHFKIVIQHKVVAQDFETVLPFVRVNYFVASPNSIRHYSLDLREDVKPKVDVQVWHRLV
jgi:hypothetical protein